MMFIKEKLAYFILISLSVFSFFSLGIKPIPPQLELKKSERILHSKELSNFFLPSPSLVEQKNSEIPKKFFSFLSLDVIFFCTTLFFTKSIIFSLVLFESSNNLSYSGQKIQILSARSHPPTYI